MTLTPLNLTVALTPPYPVVIGAGLLARAGEYVRAPRVALISDETVAPRYAEAVRASLIAAGSRVFLYTVPEGEASKSLTTLETLLRRMAQDGFNRQDAVVALGGGVVSDLAGFVAASYMRGIDFYIFSTTLLGMADAAVGGKTGVNLPEGKNLVGAFWQPKTVLMDVSVLATLPEREFRGGAVEVFKHGAARRPTAFRRRDRRQVSPRRSHRIPCSERFPARSRSRPISSPKTNAKAGGAPISIWVTRSPHALEAASNHTLSHGDAVAYGLLFAAKLAAARGYADETERVAAFVRWVDLAPLPVGGPRAAFTVYRP